MLLRDLKCLKWVYMCLDKKASIIDTENMIAASVVTIIILVVVVTWMKSSFCYFSYKKIKQVFQSDIETNPI